MKENLLSSPSRARTLILHPHILERIALIHAFGSPSLSPCRSHTSFLAERLWCVPTPPRSLHDRLSVLID